MSLVLFVRLLEYLYQITDAQWQFRNDCVLCPSRYCNLQSEKACVASHHFNHEEPLVAGSRVAQLHDCVERGVHCCIKAYGLISACNVIVDRAGYSDGREAQIVKCLSPVK